MPGNACYGASLRTVINRMPASPAKKKMVFVESKVPQEVSPFHTRD